MKQIKTKFLEGGCPTLNEITDFAFKGGTRNDVTVYSSQAFWSWAKSKVERSYSLQEIKSCLKFLINNRYYFQVGSKKSIVGSVKVALYNEKCSLQLY